jgi:hypothetical protein
MYVKAPTSGAFESVIMQFFRPEQSAAPTGELTRGA